MMTLTFGLAIAALRLTGSAGEAAAGELPKDACALLKAAEIQALAPNAKIGNGVSDNMAPMGAGCTHTWGPRTREWGESALTITVIDAAKAWPGTRPDVLQQGVLAKVKVGGPDASVVQGVGDAAAFTFEARSSNATAEAYLKAKGIHLSLKYHAGDSLASKDKIVALLKVAAARL
jgi:hypothetical protein